MAEKIIRFVGGMAIGSGIILAGYFALKALGYIPAHQ
jgi:hypothetical protein